jgi:iron complex outermembrane receptor protein
VKDLKFNKNKVAMSIATIMACISFSAISAENTSAEQEADVEVINVTGSRISRTEMEGIAPIVVFSKADLDASSATNLGAFIQKIPAISGPAESHAAQFATGTATATLRGLAARNTLVLVNGRRLGSSGIGGSADLNTIPMSAVKSIEVVQDGASAVYGSDAIAGVVNIIMNDDFDGLQVKLNYGQSSRSDNEETGIDITYGIDSDKGNLLVNYSRNRENGYVMAERAIQSDPDRRGEGGVNLRDPFSSYGTTYNIDGDWYTLKDNAERFNTMDDLRPYNHPWDESWYPGDVPVGDEDGFNYWLYDMGSADYDVENLWVSGSREFDNDIKVFFEYLQNDRESLSRSQPYAFTSDFGDPVTYSANNDYNTYGQDMNVARAIMELGAREVYDTETSTNRLVLGIQGEISDWDWDLSYNRNRTETYNNIMGVSYARVKAAAGDSDDCRARNDGCVPLDLMGRVGTITPEMLNYLQRDAKSKFDSSMESYQFNITGSVLELPAGDLQVALGAEYRTENMSKDEASIDNEGDRIFVAKLSDTVAPERTVKEVYGEVVIPLLADMPGAKLLEVDFAARYSNYSDFGSTTTPKFGLKWQPMKGMLVRGSYSQGFRAPGFDELYSGLLGGFMYTQDPCAKDDYQSKPGCPQDLGGPAPQGTGSFVYTGGNAELQPEDAESSNIGIVWAPTFIDGFSISLDRFQIEKTNVIQKTLSSQVLEKNADGEAGFEDAVDRFASGQIEAVYTLYENLGYQSVSGYDTEIMYAFETESLGGFDLNFKATYMTEFASGTDANDAKDNDSIGNWYESSGSYPELKATFVATWQFNDFTTVWSSRYVDSVIAAPGEGYWLDEELKNIDSNLTHDAQLNYNVNQFDTLLTVGIKNVFDQAPPAVVGSFRNGYDAHTYSSQGRYYYVRMTMNF